MSYEDDEPSYESSPSPQSDGAVTDSPVSVIFDARAMFDSVVRTTSNSVFQKSSGEIAKAVHAQVSATIAEKVGAVIDGALESEFQPRNEYGEPKGESTTLKAMIGRAGEKYLGEMVDKDGRPCRYGDNMTRIEYLINRAVEKHIDYRQKQEIEKAVKLATEQAQAKVGEVVASMIMKLSK
jgi:hypothetical protein